MFLLSSLKELRHTLSTHARPAVCVTSATAGLSARSRVGEEHVVIDIEAKESGAKACREPVAPKVAICCHAIAESKKMPGIVCDPAINAQKLRTLFVNASVPPDAAPVELPANRTNTGRRADVSSNASTATGSFSPGIKTPQAVAAASPEVSPPKSNEELFEAAGGVLRGIREEGSSGDLPAPPTNPFDSKDKVGAYPTKQDSTIHENETTEYSSDNVHQMGGTRKRKVSPNDFIFLRVLGKGSYGTVMLVKSTFDNQIYAMKMLRKDNIIRRHQVQHTRFERAVLESLRHPFIVELYYAFQTPKKLYFVMEYCPGGELFFHLSRANRFSEGRVRFYAAEIVLALEFLHNLNIVYRDLKPENVLLDSEGHVRLTDFGLSKGGIADNFSTKSLCGTPEYLAPEILNQQGHGKAVDWWSLGALIFEMLTGLPPFYSKDRDRLFDNIRNGELRFPSCVGQVAKDLLQKLFVRNPDRRLGGGRRDALEVKEHPFFANISWDDVQNKRLIPPFRPQLKSQTDVQYFDREFLRLPAVNSEAPDSAMGDAVRDELFPGFTYDLRDKNAFI